MRPLLTILFCFLLAGTQAAFPSLGTPSATEKAFQAPCSCSGCETTCCPAPAGRSSVPLPAIPSSAQHQLDWQGLPEHSSPAPLRLTTQERAMVQPSLLPSKGSVPLYEWNCAYLI